MNCGLIVLYIITFIGMGISIMKHGKEETKKNNFFSWLFASLLQWVLIWWACGWKFI